MKHATVPFPSVPTSRSASCALTTFVANVHQMLDATTSESRRRQAEACALAQLPVVRALGVFDLFAVRDPALATLLRDELAQLDRPALHSVSRGHPLRCAHK